MRPLVITSGYKVSSEKERAVWLFHTLKRVDFLQFPGSLKHSNTPSHKPDILHLPRLAQVQNKSISAFARQLAFQIREPLHTPIRSRSFYFWSSPELAMKTKEKERSTDRLSTFSLYTPFPSSKKKKELVGRWQEEPKNARVVRAELKAVPYFWASSLLHLPQSARIRAAHVRAKATLLLAFLLWATFLTDRCHAPTLDRGPAYMSVVKTAETMLEGRDFI